MFGNCFEFVCFDLVEHYLSNCQEAEVGRCPPYCACPSYLLVTSGLGFLALIGCTPHLTSRPGFSEVTYFLIGRLQKIHRGCRFRFSQDCHQTASLCQHRCHQPHFHIHLPSHHFSMAYPVWSRPLSQPGLQTSSFSPRLWGSFGW